MFQWNPTQTVGLWLFLTLSVLYVPVTRGHFISEGIG
jgi:hypothetical protein